MFRNASEGRDYVSSEEQLPDVKGEAGVTEAILEEY